MASWWERVQGVLGIGGRRSPKEEAAGARRTRPARQRDMVEALIDGLLHHEIPDVRAGAARNLGELGLRAGPRGIEALTRALRDPDAGVRSSAALSLGEFGLDASNYIDELIELLGDPDDDVRSSAGIALEDIGAPARPALEQALDHESALVRAEAKATLERLEEH